MADVNRGNRPLSPHLEVYRMQHNMLSSGVHRIAGCALSVSAALVVWWFVAAATGRGSFAFANAVLGSWIGNLVLLLSAASLWYHLFNGVRHLFWDAGLGFDLRTLERSVYAVLGATVLMTVITIIAVQ